MNRSNFDDSTSNSLAAIHDAINTLHEQSKTELLENLLSPESYRKNLPHPHPVRRYLIGGLGLSVVATVILLTFWLTGPISPAVAMQRMAEALEKVNAYSYRMESVYISRKGEGRTVRQITAGRWRTEPVALQATMHIIETLGTNSKSPGEPKTIVDLEESHQDGGRSIIIDHLKKEFWIVAHEIDAKFIPPGSPQVAVYMVQQRRGRVLRDLGEKKINGRVARGLEILLDNTQPMSDLGATTPGHDDANWHWQDMNIKVWIDSVTNLPIEFRCSRQGDDFETTYLFNDLHWNVEFDETELHAAAPDGYKQLDEPPWPVEE